MLATYDAVAALTDTFCCDKLNDEYRGLARAMTAALCRKRPSPLTSGQRRTWACSIIYVLGQINFLSDKATPPYMAMAEVCAALRRSEHGERQGSGHFGVPTIIGSATIGHPALRTQSDGQPAGDP
jgi:uncharacterized protein DUF6398